MDEAILADLKKRAPQYTALFERLYDNYRFVPCSGHFRFGLNKLVLLVLNRLGTESIGRFRAAITADTLHKMALAEARQLSNLVIYDEKSKKVLFDLKELKI